MRAVFGKRKCPVILALLLIAIALIAAAAGTVSASAYTAEEEAALNELETEISELLDALDTEELQEYLNSLSGVPERDVKDILAELITGDYALDYSGLWQSALSFVMEEGKGMLPAFAVVLAVTLLCGILNSAKNGFLHSNMSDIINFISYLAVGSVVLAVLTGLLETGFQTMSELGRQMETVYPVLLTLMAASGGSVSAGIFRPAVAFLAGGIGELFSSVVLPVSVVVIVLTFVGSLSADVRTEKLGDFFKGINKWLIGLTLGIMSLFLTIQGIASAQYDGITLRTVKYLVSGSVPIVGGFLSGGLDLVLAGSALIKNAVGGFAVFLIAASLLRPVLLFAAFQLFLRLCAAATEPAGGKVSSFLSRLASDTSFFLAGICCVAFLYFLTIVLLVCSTGVILG